MVFYTACCHSWECLGCWAQRPLAPQLAKQINRTPEDLARLQEEALTEERARALRERIVQVTTA